MFLMDYCTSMEPTILMDCRLFSSSDESMWLFIAGSDEMENAEPRTSDLLACVSLAENCRRSCYFMGIPQSDVSLPQL